MADDLIESNIFLRMELHFKVIEVAKAELTSNEWHCSVDLMPASSFTESSNEVVGTLAKIRYWINEIVNGSVLISAQDKWAVKQFIRRNPKDLINNNIVLLPGPVTGGLIAKVIHSKLVALASDFLIIGPLEVTSDESCGLSFFYAGDDIGALPSTSEWIGERSYFEEPWWNRNDSSTMDVAPLPSDDLNVKPEFATSLDFLLTPQKRRKRPRTNAVITEFRPKVITGGL